MIAEIFMESCSFRGVLISRVFYEMNQCRRQKYNRFEMGQRGCQGGSPLRKEVLPGVDSSHDLSTPPAKPTSPESTLSDEGKTLYASYPLKDTSVVRRRGEGQKVVLPPALGR